MGGRGGGVLRQIKKIHILNRKYYFYIFIFYAVIFLDIIMFRNVNMTSMIS